MADSRARAERAARLLLALLLLSLHAAHAVEPIPQAADLLTAVNISSQQDIRLDANLYIPDGQELLLTIQVPRESIQVNGDGPAKVVRAYSTASNGTYGIGALIPIAVQFTNAVDVVGTPTLALRSGCHTTSCNVYEVQRLRCVATAGKFAIAFSDQRVVNIPYDASPKHLADFLTRMTHIDKVQVDYNIDDAACTFFGNNITITFVSMNIDGIDGDLPQLTTDMTNAQGDGNVLQHIHYAPSLTSVAWEIQKGQRAPDRLAPFTSQPFPDTLQFSYTVQPGDSASVLEYAGSAALERSLKTGRVAIYNSGTLVNANPKLPPPGSADDWERGFGSSLSWNSALCINVSAPVVINVSSSHVDGTFGIGESIPIQIYFSQPIVVTGTPTIVLETGQVDRIVMFTEVLQPAGTIAEFIYVVQAGDTSPDLSYTSTTALQLNGGAIKRASATPTTDANLTLPSTAATGSLSVNKNLVIDTTKPKVIGLSAVTAGGTYTAGDIISIQVRFDNPVIITGTPQLLLSTTSVDLFPGSGVQAAPAAQSNKTILFPNVEHGLSTANSQGLQFSIGGQILTVSSVNGDLVTMVENYTGTVVDPRIIGAEIVLIKSPGYRAAIYVSGSNTTALRFKYQVQKGDYSTDLDCMSTNALILNGGSIKRSSTTPFTDADLTLPTPGATASLGDTAAIVVNTNAPRILQTNFITRNGVYRSGDSIYLAVVFDAPVVVFNTASILMTATQPERSALYDSGSGSTTLVFRFDCQPLDQASVFDVVGTNALRASYGEIFGWIRRRAVSPMVSAILTLPVAGMTSKGVSIDSSRGFVASVQSTHANGTFGTGEVIDVVVTYTGAVNVDTTNGVPTLTMTTGRLATYTSGSGTTALTFRYVVLVGDVTTQLDCASIFALVLNGASITDAGTGLLVSTLLPKPTASSTILQNAITINTSPPTVVDVTTRALGNVYTVGDTIVISVQMDRPVDVPAVTVGAGTPALILNAGVHDGVRAPFLVNSADRLYFAYTVAAGHSTALLAYMDRTALICVDGDGVNKERTMDAQFAHGVVLPGTPSRVFITWTEMTAAGTGQIHVKAYATDRFPPLWSYQEGTGINWNAAMHATGPMLVRLGTGLYLVWQETSSATNNPSQIRVASYNGVLTAPQWTFVEKLAPNDVGLNKDATQNAATPHATIHSFKLYAAWHETIATATAPQIRVAVYNGQDAAPVWTFVDGNQAGRGLNYGAASPAENVRLVSCASLNNATAILYAAWEEQEPTTRVQQIRVAVQTKPDNAPKWTHLTGKAAFGINVDTAMDGRAPTLSCYGSTIVVAWHEATAATLNTLIRVKQFNGNITNPSWASLDGSKGINSDLTQNAANVRLRVSNSQLYAAWQEVGSVSLVTHARVAMLSSVTNGVASWSFLDQRDHVSSLNQDSTRNAAYPVMIMGSAYTTMVAVWQEINANGKYHVRASTWGAAASQWQSLLDSCVRTLSTSSTTAANLLLPEVSTIGSLDFNHAIRIDTSSPVVRNVRLQGEVPATLSVAYAIQTIDVFNTASLIQGEYRLTYGHDHVTACIAWNASAAAVTNALESIPSLALSVSVALDTTAFQDGQRYSITFLFPSMGLKQLRVQEGTNGLCQPFVCSANARIPCGLNLICVNENTDVVLHGGVVDASVEFSFPVVVSTGLPAITLDTGTFDQVAVYTTRSAFQEFDVGTNSPSFIVEGAFRLVYGDFSTGVGVGTILQTDCIDISPIDSDAIEALTTQLKSIAPINTIGIRSVTRKRLQTGFRYGITFRNSADLLDLVPADASACRQYAGRTQTIDISAASSILQGEYKIQFGANTSACISWNLSAIEVQEILSAIVPDRVVLLQVASDPSLFPVGHRYYITFMRLDDAREPLVVSADPNCVAFSCDNGAGGSIACSTLVLAVNSDFAVTRAASETISFQYTIQSQDESLALTYAGASSLSGTVLRCAKTPTIAASLGLSWPATPLKGSVNGLFVSIVSSQATPVIVQVYSPTQADTYTAGDVIVLLVEFSQAVIVNGQAPVLELNSVGAAIYFAGSGSATLEFRYRIEPGESSSVLDYQSTVSLRTLVDTTLISGDNWEIEAWLALPAPGASGSISSSKTFTVDTSTPVIISVFASHAHTDTYGLGDVVDIIVEFSQDVSVLGTPSLVLNTGGSAYYSLGGYRQVIDVGVNSIVPLRSGQFAVKYKDQVSGCIDFNDAQSAATTSFKSRLLEFAELQQIGVDSVTLTAKKSGHRFVVVFQSTNVLDVPAALSISPFDICGPLDPPSLDPLGLLVTRTTDQYVTFQYAIAVGETTLLLDYAATSLSLTANTDSILRNARVPTILANVALPNNTVPANRLSGGSVVSVDGSAIGIVDVISDTADGTYGVGYPAIASPTTVFPGEILFRLIFSRPVKFVGSPAIELVTGSLQASSLLLPNRFAKYVNQPSPTEAAFLYQIQEGDYSTNLAFSSTNVLSNAQIYAVAAVPSLVTNLQVPRLALSSTGIIAIDSLSVPTTVNISSPHANGVFGAGEVIELDVTLSKQVILQSGLNRNQQWYARNSVALEFQSNVYVMWTEWEKMTKPTKSYLYLNVYASDTLELVTTASPGAINKVPNTFIERASMVVWNSHLYAAWDEGGLLFCAVYNGLNASDAWTLIPNMGANKNMQMAASNAILVVQNLVLLVIWREMALPINSATMVGQIRVAQRNDDYDAPLWIFHDGNSDTAGLNRNPLMDAVDPSVAVYRSVMYIAWAEATADGVYEIVVAKRYLETRDVSTWGYLTPQASTKAAYNFISAYKPQLAVRRRGIEDVALQIMWYRGTVNENVSEIVTGQILLDGSWEASATSPPLLFASNGSADALNAERPKLASCGSSVFASWIEIDPSSRIHVAKLAVLYSTFDLYNGWQTVFDGNANQNPLADVDSTELICTSAATASPQMGLFWTEFDGFTTKLRFRHASLPQPTRNLTSWGEISTGTPLIKMATGTTPPGYAQCVDFSGVLTYTLHFAFIVQPGFTTPALNVFDTGAILLNGALIQDLQGHDPDLRLFPGLQDPRSLAFSSDIVLDTSEPRVQMVTSTTVSGEYGVGQYIQIQVVFSSPVILAPEVNTSVLLYLRSDDLHYYEIAPRAATYLSGSRSNTLTFEYTTVSLDYCTALDYADVDSLTLQATATIKREATFPTTVAQLVLPVPRSAQSLSGQRQIAIRTTAPQVLSVMSSTSNGTYFPGDVITIQVVFSLPVTVFGSPFLELDTSQSDPATATYASGNESTTLGFAYTVQAGDFSSDLELIDDRGNDLVINYVHSLILPLGAQIKRTATYPTTFASIVLPARGFAGSLSRNKNLVIDSTVPTIVDIRSPTANGTYTIGQEIIILVEFSRNIVVQGTPLLQLNVLAESECVATYKSGSTTTVLAFSYIPVEGDSTDNIPLDYQSYTSFILRPPLAPSTVQSASAQVLLLSSHPIVPANVSLPRPGTPLTVNAVRSLVGNNQKIYVRTDGFQVQDMAADVPSGVTYAPGQRIVLSVTFTDVVIVQGALQLQLNVNALIPRYATYLDGSGSPTLRFVYIVVLSDSATVLEAASRSALELNGGVITDADGIYVPLQLGAPGFAGSLSHRFQIRISSTPPVVRRVYAQPAVGVYGVGDVVSIAVEFSTNVTLSATAPAAPTLLVQLDGQTQLFTYASGNTSCALVFTFQIAAGQAAWDLEYVDQHSLVGTILALSTTPTLPANLLLPVPGAAHSLSDTSAVQVETTAPTVLAVQAVARNGTYGLYDRVRIRVRYSYTVMVAPVSTSNCRLELSVGHKRIATAKYSGGSGTNTLEFEYRVESGDMASRLNYVGSQSLSCNVLQYSANPRFEASTTLPSPGQSTSLGLSSNLHIDSTAIRVVSVSSPLANGVYCSGQDIDITVAFSGAVVLENGVPRLQLALASNAQGDATSLRGAVYATYLAGSGTTTLTFRYRTVHGDMALPLTYHGIDALSMAPTDARILSVDGNRPVAMRLPSPLATGSLANNRDIRIDTLDLPRVIAVGSQTADGSYTAGDIVLISVMFTAPVVVVGTPILQLETGNLNGVGMAQYISGSGTSSLVFAYAVQLGDNTERLEYTRCPDTARRTIKRREWSKLVLCSASFNALQLPMGASIKRLATVPMTDAILDLPEVNAWPKIRFDSARNGYIYVDQVELTTDTIADDKAELAAAVLAVNEFSMSEQTNAIYIYSSGVPDHASSLWSVQQLKQQAYFIALARFPKQKSNPLTTSVPTVSGSSSVLLLGIFFNGIPFTNLRRLGNLSEIGIDACGGTVDAQSRYIYVAHPTCYLESVQESADPMAAFPHTPSPVVGYAFDGFPIYGYYDENGQLPALDECNGRLAANGQYVYHLVPPWASSTSPTAFMPCLKGVDSTAGSTLLKVFRSPADIGEIQGLSLPLLSQFDGFVIDETQEALEKASVWLNPSGVSVVYTASSVIVRSNGIPDGEYGPFPNVYNIHRVTEQDYVFALPRQPILAATATPLPLDAPIGAMLNGIPFFASTSAVYGDVMSSSSQALLLLDKCNGLVDAGGDYRYYASPDCLLEQLGVSLTQMNQPSPLIGYALDGFPLYGPYTEAGMLPTDLDACNGRIGDDGNYRYHVTTTAPYLIGCFHGILPSSTNANNIYRSLSYAHALRLNTDPPQVAQIYSNKWPGTYVAGETLDLVIQWSAPVSVVTAAGVPCVMMAGLQHEACYDASRSSSLESVFMFHVAAGDTAADWTYVARSQVQLNGGSILRLSAVPTVNADPRLVLAERLPLLASKHQIIQSVRVDLRGLYHPSAMDLRVNLYHQRRRALVFGGCCAATDAFGVPDQKVHVNTEQINIYLSNPTSGMGFDYTFQDLPGSAQNLALTGGAIALQSSTSGHCVASYAIDGVIGGRVSTQTVARTTSESDALAWWELRLLHAHSLGTIRIWLLDEDQEMRPGIVQIVSVDSMDGIQPVDGSFTLAFTGADGFTQTTADISFNAVAMATDEQVRVTAVGIGKGESMQSKLAALANMPAVFVTRSPADAAMSDNGAFTWSITFLGDPRAVGLASTSPLSLDINAVCSGMGTVAITRPLPGDDHDDWSYETRDDRAANVSIGKLSMVPFWVLLFDATAMLNVESLSEAVDAAIWYQRIDADWLGLTSERVVVLSPPLELEPTQFIRIMTENPFAYLTIDEVQVFEQRTHVLSQYPGGTPVSTQWFPFGESWSPEEPFDATFAGLNSEGVWTLAIRDTIPVQTTGPLQTSHWAGAISDYVLYVTNMAGRTTRHTMDMVAHVRTLPRHGRLFVGTNETERDHLDFDGNGVLDSVEAMAYLERFVPRYERLPRELQSRVLTNFLSSYESFGGIPVLTDPSERQKLFPILCDRACLEAYGIDPYFYFGTTGDTGTKRLVLGEDRTVRYVPNPGFHGVDAFTFTITIGAQTSAVQGTVELHVLDCRGNDCGSNSRYLHRWHR